MSLLLYACTSAPGETAKDGPVENTAPTAVVRSPAEGATLVEGEPVALTVEIGDAESALADLLVVGVSDRAGILTGDTAVTGPLASTTLPEGLSVGQHVLSAIVSDPEEASTTASVSVEVVPNGAPTAAFAAPTANAAYVAGEPVLVSVGVADDLDAPSALDLAWSGVAEGVGPTRADAAGLASFSLVDLAPGAHVVGLSVTDSGGAAATAQAAFEVVSDADGDGWIDVATGGDDCDDADPDVHPAADETCEGTDGDCDGEVDEDAVDAHRWYADGDGHGYGSA